MSRGLLYHLPTVSTMILLRGFLVIPLIVFRYQVVNMLHWNLTRTKHLAVIRSHSYTFTFSEKTQVQAEVFACEDPVFHGRMSSGAVGHRGMEQELRCVLRGFTKPRDSSACGWIPVGQLLQGSRRGTAQTSPSKSFSPLQPMGYSKSFDQTFGRPPEEAVVPWRLDAHTGVLFIFSKSTRN